MDGVHHPNAAGTLRGAGGLDAKNSLAGLDTRVKLAVIPHNTRGVREYLDTYNWNRTASSLAAMRSTGALELARSIDGSGRCG